MAVAAHLRRRCGALARSSCVALLLAISAPTPSMAVGSGAEGVLQGEIDARIANAWRVLRVVDCARCHGKDYAGLAGPSIVDFAARDEYERFVRMTLDGNPGRGMPGYRSNVYVVDNIDDIYRYFRARAAGDVSADYRPPPLAEQRQKTVPSGDAPQPPVSSRFR